MPCTADSARSRVFLESDHVLFIFPRGYENNLGRKSQARARARNDRTSHAISHITGARHCPRLPANSNEDIRCIFQADIPTHPDYIARRCNTAMRFIVAVHITASIIYFRCFRRARNETKRLTLTSSGKTARYFCPGFSHVACILPAGCAHGSKSKSTFELA